MALKREAVAWCRRTYQGHRRMLKACFAGVKMASSTGSFIDAAEGCRSKGLPAVELAACTVGAGRMAPKGSRMSGMGHITSLENSKVEQALWMADQHCNKNHNGANRYGCQDGLRIAREELKYAGFKVSPSRY